MPSLTPEELMQIRKDDTTPYTVFIETGTYKGETVHAMETLFRELHTIEIVPELYEAAKSQNTCDAIHFHLGDSSLLLPQILPKISEPIVFWLDGHLSGFQYAGGDKDVPLLEELDAIMKSVKNRALLIIDDCRLFGTEICEDWSEITIKAISDRVHSRTEKWEWFPSELDPRDRLAIWLAPLPVA